MSLYNMVMGVNPHARALLELVGVDIKRVPRFRDVVLRGGGSTVGLLTRTGGNNREGHQLDNDYLVGLPTFLVDEDDKYDSTFAWFWYGVPEERRVFAETTLQEDRKRGPIEFVEISEAAMKPNADLSDQHILRAFTAGEAMAAAMQDMMDGKPVGDVTIDGHTVTFKSVPGSN